MPAPKIPAVVADVERLNEPFKSKAKALLESIAKDRLPMMVFETLRPLERQAWLHAKGYSRAAGPNGPHPWGLAIDVVLDPKSREWIEIGSRPLAIGGGGANWDTGYNPTKDGLVLARPGVAHVVRTFGELVKAQGLQWGGVNAGAWADGRKGSEFGWDPFHVQMPGWRQWCAHLPPPS
jgi:hypothetical protein